MSYYGRNYYDKYFQTKGVKALADLDKPLYHDSFAYKLFHHKELSAEYDFINTHLRRHCPSIDELHMEVHNLILSKEFSTYGNCRQNKTNTSKPLIFLFQIDSPSRNIQFHFKMIHYPKFTSTNDWI